MTLVVPALAGCSSAVLDPKGPIGAADRTILIDSLVIMLAIVIPTIIATFAFAWWFRASNTRAKYLPDWEFSGRIELVVWSIPLMVILLLGGVTWIGSHELDPAKPIEGKGAPLDVQVVSLDWKWLFIYPEQRIATVNTLVVPAGRPLHFSLTSASVMNAFFVPQLGSMIYTMNGMKTELWLHADEPGTYPALSAHYSGEGFSDMHFDVQAVPAEQFAAWVNKVRDNPERLDGPRYDKLAQQSVKDPVMQFGLVDVDLFQRVTTNELKPGPGPELEHHGAAQVSEIEGPKGAPNDPPMPGMSKEKAH
jgi:cytochrome o ubiquinol oxidase subunit 2